MVSQQGNCLGLLSTEGAVTFCRIRGYLSTLRKQGLHIFSALEATLRGHPLLKAVTRKPERSR